MSLSRLITVPGMTCQHCVDAVTREIGALAGVDSVAIDLATKVVTVLGTALDDAALRLAIDEAGFEVASIAEA